MPNIDDGAKQWQESLAAEVGRAVRYWRDEVRGYTASALSERCSNLGYPISRVAISKIENGARAGKLELAEILVLARALDVSPIQLFIGGLPDGAMMVTPNCEMRALDALLWFEGRGKVHQDPLLSSRPAWEEIEFSQEETERDQQNVRYAEATKWSDLIEQLIVSEKSLQVKISQLRHPGYSGGTEESAARRDVVVEKLNKLIDRAHELEKQMIEEGLVVNPSRGLHD